VQGLVPITRVANQRSPHGRRRRRPARGDHHRQQLIRLGDRAAQLAEATAPAPSTSGHAGARRLALRRTRQQQVSSALFIRRPWRLFVARDGRIQSANLRAGDLLEFQPAAVVGASVLDVLGTSLGHVGSELPWRQTLETLLASPDVTRVGDVQHPATRRVIQWAAQPTRDEFGTTVGLTFTFQDVTRNRDLIRQLGYKSIQLEEANRRMEEASRAKEEFLANVSHEIPPVGDHRHDPRAGVKNTPIASSTRG
jgi:PAS domain-containing protein